MSTATPADDHMQPPPRYAVKPLSWYYVGAGEWQAMSRHSQLWFDIGVCNDGTFDVSESDRRLIPHEPKKPATFETLAEAKAFCQRVDDERA